MIMPGLVTQHAGPPEARLEFALYRCATPNQEERPVTVKHPSVEELACIAQAYHLSPTRQDLESFSALMTSTLFSYARLDQLTEPTLPVHYPRRPGYRPQPQDNPLGAWYWRCEITGVTSAPNGLLAGTSTRARTRIRRPHSPLPSNIARSSLRKAFSST